MRWKILNPLPWSRDEQVELAYLLQSVDGRCAVSRVIRHACLCYLPASADPATELPVLFNQVPVPFRGELEILNSEYEVITGAHGKGTYYFAKDLAVFAIASQPMDGYPFNICRCRHFVSLALAVLTARQISRPLSRLARDSGSLIGLWSGGRGYESRNCGILRWRLIAIWMSSVSF